MCEWVLTSDVWMGESYVDDACVGDGDVDVK
jgi:hypothetical protein